MAPSASALVPVAPAPAGVAPVRVRVLVALAIALVAAATFAPALWHPFVMYDDPVYVTENPWTLAGVSWAGVKHAFTALEESNWHPLTWLSHMADAQLFGTRPAGHHATSVALHALDAALLFWLLASATGRTGRSAFAAVLFAVHPLRVESVAWVSERKDVLSGAFFLLALIAYVAYARRPGLGRYALVLAAAAGALMSKPTTVVLPVILLLLDAWPLRRFERGRAGALLLEKLPVAAMAVAAAVLTYVAQSAGGATTLVGPMPLPARVANAAVACAAYLADFFWPAGLAVFYPFPAGGHGALAVALSLAVLAGLAALAVATRRRWPFVAFGGAWFLVAVAPMLGLVQAGAQARADRYTYLPVIGIAIAVAWLAGEFVGDPAAVPGRRNVAIAAAALCTVALVGATELQLRHWRSDVALFAHAALVTDANWVAHHNLAIALSREGRFEEAVREDRVALRLVPASYAETYKYHSSLADSLERLGALEEAAREFETVLRSEPDEPHALNDLGILYARLGDVGRALAHFERAVARVPRDPRLRLNFGIVLGRAGYARDAAQQFRIGLALNPPPDVAAPLSALAAQVAE